MVMQGVIFSKCRINEKSDTGENYKQSGIPGLYYEGTLVKNAISDANGVVTLIV